MRDQSWDSRKTLDGEGLGFCHLTGGVLIQQIEAKLSRGLHLGWELHASGLEALLQPGCTLKLPRSCARCLPQGF